MWILDFSTVTSENSLGLFGNYHKHCLFFYRFNRNKIYSVTCTRIKNVYDIIILLPSKSTRKYITYAIPTIRVERLMSFKNRRFR